MDNLKSLFERQAKWQHTRAKLSWTEKLRMAEIMRETALEMRSSNKTLKKQAKTEKTS